MKLVLDLPEWDDDLEVAMAIASGVAKRMGRPAAFLVTDEEWKRGVDEDLVVVTCLAP